jgi:hypothetical protein
MALTESLWAGIARDTLCGARNELWKRFILSTTNEISREKLTKLTKKNRGDNLCCSSQNLPLHPCITAPQGVVRVMCTGEYDERPFLPPNV